MDIFLVLGVITGILSVVVGMIVKGANVAVLLNPAAAIIIIVGTTAAVMNSFPKKEFLNIPKVLGALFREKEKEDQGDLVQQIVVMAQETRKNGLLSLEKVAQNTESKFLKKGLEMVADGIDPEVISDTLTIEIESMEARHRLGASFFTSAGGAAPTLGVLGAVIGLIGALGDLTDTEKLGHMISAAFVATLYGIFIGYVICHPFASRLKRKSHEEISNMYIMMEGILAMQSGANPNSIEKKLVGMIEPKYRTKFESKSNEK